MIYKKNQAGRSMIEIIGVLAVMGLLAAASIWSVRYAFYVHRENQTIDTISKTVAGAVTGYMENSGIGEAVEGTAGRIQLAAEQVMSGVPTKNGGMTITTPLDAELTVWVPASNTVEVEVENLTYSVCDRILISNSDYVSAWLTGKDWEGV